MLSKYFIKTTNDFERAKIFAFKCYYSFKEETYIFFYKIKHKLLRHTNNVNKYFKHSKMNGLNPKIKTNESIKPIIFASACVSKDIPGGWKYNGGIKELNQLVKLLRRYGYEAYMVTYDGNFEPWLIEHQYYISIDTFQNIMSKTKNVRCVTSWAEAYCFINSCNELYFWDMELAYTDNIHFKSLSSLYSSKIINTAGISRTIQAWHMNNFRRYCTVIPNICDEKIWYPNESVRVFNRVGYMYEGDHTNDTIKYLYEYAQSNGLYLDFILIKGCESDVLSLMRTCNVFVSINIGKDLLWGEGCPRTIMEALSVGCIPIAFDIIGNRETLIHNFNGLIVPRYRHDLMAEALFNLFSSNDQIKIFRDQSRLLLNACHKMDSRWPAVRQFLNL